MSEWKPIESAPKYERVLVFGEDVHRVAGETAVGVSEAWAMDDKGCVWLGPIYVKLTHWMPLPDPPVVRDERLTPR